MFMVSDEVLAMDETVVLGGTPVPVTDAPTASCPNSAPALVSVLEPEVVPHEMDAVVVRYRSTMRILA